MRETPAKPVYEPVPTSHYLQRLPKKAYYSGDFKIGLNLYSLHYNLNLWLQNGKEGALAIDTTQAVRWAKQAGFDTIDITAYYIPGYQGYTMPSLPDEEILAYVHRLRQLAEEIGIAISCTGVRNNFAEPNEDVRARDIAHVKYWIDVAAAMGTPLIRVFSGLVPPDLAEFGWEAITRERIAPALRECAEYGAARGVKIGMQNHADMASTADQTIRMIEWVEHPNVGVINDTGSFRPFQAKNGDGYSWYDDIEAVLPITCGFQLKTKPAGASIDTPIDLEQFFTRLRVNGYDGCIPIETLWTGGDPLHPKLLSGPPYDQIADFLATVRAAAERTKQRPL